MTDLPEESRLGRSVASLVAVLALIGASCATSREVHSVPDDQDRVTARVVVGAPIASPPIVQDPVAAGRMDTVVALPRGGAVTLVGGWTRRSEMWPDMALAYNGDGQFMVLDGGQRQARLVHADGGMSEPAWSADGRTLYAWMGSEGQLTAVDVATGETRSLTSLGKHVWSYEFQEHLDPRPVTCSRGVVEDAAAGRLLLVLREEFNDEVAFWQRREGRGGTSLVSVNLADATLSELVPKGIMPPLFFSWDVALRRQRIFLIGRTQLAYRPAEGWCVQERDFAGNLIRAIPEPEGRAGKVLVSPDESRLLVERSCKPDLGIPQATLDTMSRDEIASVVRSPNGGFVLIDLDSGQVTDGPRSGCEAVWSPDGSRIAYADAWGVGLFDVATGDTEWLVEKAPEESSTSWIDLAWSPDGRRLALSTWDRHFWLMLDLVEREYLLREGRAQHLIWSRAPRPFGG